MRPERADNSGCIPMLIALVVGLTFWTIVFATINS